MNVLLTGASGFVGGHLLNLLLKKGANVFTLGRTPSAGAKHYFLAWPWRKEDIFTIVKEVRPDYFFHLAGKHSSGSLKEAIDINASLCQILLDAITYCGFQNLTKCMLFGSAAEYGPILDGDLPLSEKYECNPISNYGISKLMQTNYALKWSREGGIASVIRPFSIFGPNMPTYLAVGSFSKKIQKLANKGLKKGVIQTGNINVQRDFIDVNDVIEICWKLINNDQVNGQIINVCSGKALKLRTIVEYMADLNNLDLSIEENKSLLRSNDPLIHYGSNAKLIDLIDSYEFIPWKETLRGIMGRR
jgi:nucleoside-diphosphate-sugar epimerase